MTGLPWLTIHVMHLFFRLRHKKKFCGEWGYKQKSRLTEVLPNPLPFGAFSFAIFRFEERPEMVYWFPGVCSGPNSGFKEFPPNDLLRRLPHGTVRGSRFFRFIERSRALTKAARLR